MPQGDSSASLVDLDCASIFGESSATARKRHHANGDFEHDPFGATTIRLTHGRILYQDFESLAQRKCGPALVVIRLG
jgi:hypothetical protein